MNSDRQARQRALEAAKERLKKRRRQREQIQELRAQKQQGISLRKNDYGKKLVEETKRLISDWRQSTQKQETENKTQEEESINSNVSSQAIVPGIRADLAFVDGINIINISKRDTVEYVKEVQTDAIEIAQSAKLITQKTSIAQMTDILSTFIERDSTPYPKVFERKKALKQSKEEKNNDGASSSKNANNDGGAAGGGAAGADGDDFKDDEDRRANMLVMDDIRAQALLSDTHFLSAFRRQSTNMFDLLGTNIEHPVFLEAHSSQRDSKAGAQMEKLILAKTLSYKEVSQLAITCLDFDTDGNRLLVSYANNSFADKLDPSNAASNSYDTPEGTIYIFDLSWNKSKGKNKGKGKGASKNKSKSKHKSSASASASTSTSMSTSNVQTSTSEMKMDITSEREAKPSGGGGGATSFSASNPELIIILECQSMITCAQFHPSKEEMILGTSVSGQVLGWDISRGKKTPIIRTMFSPKSHSQPIFAMKFLPSLSKIQQILTISNDAKMCLWRDDILHDPFNSFLLKNEENEKKDNISSTCLAFNNTNNDEMWFGSDEGVLYQCVINSVNILNNESEHIPIQKTIAAAHFGPITAVTFHPRLPIFLSSSFDWTCKLWHTAFAKPIVVFSQMQDYIYDCAWSPTNCSLLACGDGSGHLTLYDLNFSIDTPVITECISKEFAITKVRFSPSGAQVVAGDSDGNVSIYNLPTVLIESSEVAFEKLQGLIKIFLRQ